MNAKQTKLAVAMGAALALAGVQGEALALQIRPDDAGWTSDYQKAFNDWDVTDNDKSDTILEDKSAFNDTGAKTYDGFDIEAPKGLEQLYKINDDGSEVGTLATSYSTVFSGSSGDYDGATISYVGGSSVSCQECFLLVKDGHASPNQYLFDLEALGWDGKVELVLSGFYPNQGAISHIDLWAQGSDVPADDDVPVPEPGTLLLFGAGLLGAGLARIRRKNG